MSSSNRRRATPYPQKERSPLTDIEKSDWTMFKVYEISTVPNIDLSHDLYLRRLTELSDNLEERCDALWQHREK